MLPIKQFLLVLLLCLSVGVQAKVPYTGMVIFGDSLSDSGNAYALTGNLSVAPYQLIPDAPYARGGMHFSNGVTWVEKLAQSLKLNIHSGPALSGASQKFSNFAVGGARSRAAGQMDLTTQVSLYLNKQGGSADPAALYVVFIGGNDVRDAIEAYAEDNTGQTSQLILHQAVTAAADNLSALASAGARHFLIATAPDLGRVPAVSAQGPLVQALASFMSGQYNQGLEGALQLLEVNLPVTMARYDVFTTINTVMASPQDYGFAVIDVPCITAGVKAMAVCKYPDEYLFWDGIHPTAAGHVVLFEAAREALSLP